MTNLFPKLSVATAGIALSLLGNITSASAADKTFFLSGSFEDTSLSGSQNTRFSTFSGTYSYSEETPDQNSETNVGVYSLSSFEIGVADVNGAETLKISESEGWTGQLDIDANAPNEAGDPLYAVVFSRERTFPETFAFRLTWDWLMEADTIPTVAPIGASRPQNSFLSEAIDPRGENEFYTVKAATVTAATPPNAVPVPEPGTIMGLSLLGLSFLVKKKLASSRNT